MLEGGPSRLTLDAVAEKAGLSKGGLLYHFPTKEALVEGMIARLIERGSARRAAALERMPEGPGRELKSEIVSRLEKRDADRRVGAAILAAVANEPRLIGTIREIHGKRFAVHMKDTCCGNRKVLLLLAADGLFLLELLQASPFDSEQRQALLDELLKLADEVVKGDVPQ